MNSCDFGNMCSSWFVSKVVIETGVPAGIVQILYLMGASGEMRGFRDETPYESRMPSWIQALRYESFSCWSECRVAVGSGNSFSSSACSLCRIRELFSRWKEVTARVHDTVSTPAPMSPLASPLRRSNFFSCGGRLLERSSSKIVGCWDFSRGWSLPLRRLPIFVPKSL